MDDSKRPIFRGYLKYALIPIFVLLEAVLAIGFLTLVMRPSYTKDNLHEQYARGVYDLCLLVSEKLLKTTDPVDDCMRTVGKAMIQGWYDRGSPSWEWPIPDGYKPTPTLAVSSSG